MAAKDSFSACDENNRGPQLSYDWLLCKHPRKTPWEVLLKIKDTGGQVWKMEAPGNGLLDL